MVMHHLQRRIDEQAAMARGLFRNQQILARGIPHQPRQWQQLTDRAASVGHAKPAHELCVEGPAFVGPLVRGPGHTRHTQTAGLATGDQEDAAEQIPGKRAPGGHIHTPDTHQLRILLVVGPQLAQKILRDLNVVVEKDDDVAGHDRCGDSSRCIQAVLYLLAMVRESEPGGYRALAQGGDERISQVAVVDDDNFIA